MRSGIYCIRNVINGKRYIGQSVDVPIRRNNHFYKLRKGVHGNHHLQSSFNKYGEDSFEFIVIEHAEAGVLDAKEASWISHYQSINPKFGFNSESGGALGKTHSDATKALISRIQTGKKRGPHSEETKRKIGEANKISRKGIKLSDEHRRKISQAGLGRRHTPESIEKLRIKTPEHLAKISAATKARWQKYRDAK